MSKKRSRNRGAAPRRSPPPFPHHTASGWLRRWRWPGLVTGVALMATVAMMVLGRRDTLAAAGSDESGTPVLRVDRESIDLGDVRLGDWVETEFTVTNAGDGPLRFARVPYVEAVAGC